MLFVLLHLMTAVLVVLKLCGALAIGWLAALSPSIVAIALALIALLIALFCVVVSFFALARR